MCCSNAAWKREEVPDHKFDFVNVHEFHATNCTTRLGYAWMYLLVIKSFAVYIADVYTAIALLASNHWSGSVLQSQAAKEGSSVLEVPFSIGKWVFAGCIIFSFLLLLWEGRKSRAIIKSRDISYAFTNVSAQNWYSLRSYDHFCFFSQIDNSKKKKDEFVLSALGVVDCKADDPCAVLRFAFFIFFTFKGWKRLLLADAPRQVINGITLYSFGQSENWTTDVSAYFGGSVLKAGIIITMLFTLAIWVGSFILLLVAAVIIAELMKRKNRKRLAKEAEIARKEAVGDYSHLKDAKTGKFKVAPLPQPTLPKFDASDYTDNDLEYKYPPDKGFGGLDRQPPMAPSGLGRNPYFYQGSDPNFQSGHSLTSLARGAAPMGYNSTANLVDRPGYGREETNLTQAPSYHSDDEKGGYYDEISYGDEYGAPPVAPVVAARQPPSTRTQGQRSDPQSQPYVPPPRQLLYERATRQSDSSLGYAQDDGRQEQVVSGYFGGWEESRQASVQPQEYYPEQPPSRAASRPRPPRQSSMPRQRQPSLDDGNMAGRGRPGGAGGLPWQGR
ncbi:hypothetical protein P7C70_g1775, partial [Phenoliferia sp. Uapishka_3]